MRGTFPQEAARGPRPPAVQTWKFYQLPRGGPIRRSPRRGSGGRMTPHAAGLPCPRPSADTMPLSPPPPPPGPYSVYFKQVVGGGGGRGDFLWGLSLSLAMMLALLVTPPLSAVADRRGGRQRGLPPHPGTQI